MSNAVRHAQAETIRVGIEQRAGRVILEVRDDGTGFDPHAPALRARHLGLTSMEERCRSLGGELVIESTPGAGTVVRAEVPLG